MNVSLRRGIDAISTDDAFISVVDIGFRTLRRSSLL